MKKFKKVLAAILAGTMVLSAMAVSAFADDEYTANIEGQFDTSVEGNFDEWQDTSSYKCTFSENSLATYTADFGQKVKFSGNYVGLTTTIPWDGESDMKANFVSIKLDGVDVAFTDAYLTAEGKTADGSSALRLNLTNQWNGDITTQPVDPSVWGTSFQKIEIQFYVGELPADEPSDPTTGDSASTALVLVAVAALAVVATVSVKKYAVER